MFAPHIRLDIVKHFPSMDHAILFETLCKEIADPRTQRLVKVIIDSGQSILDHDSDRQLFEGDDLLSLCRPRGLPIGNLTSQFWSNCYLHPLDCFVKRQLSCKPYLRYVDDFALFSNSKEQLWHWRAEVRNKLADLRLNIHEHNAQVTPTQHGIPWLGFVVYPSHIKVKSRKVVYSSRRLTSAYNAWKAGEISFAEFDARVQGWINHVRYADSWGLRRQVLKGFSR